MNKGTGTYIAIIVVAVLAVAVFFLADFGGVGRTYASPEEVIDGIRLASQKGDLRGWCECLTEQSRDFIAAEVALKEFVAKQKDPSILKILADHNLTNEHLANVMEREGMAFTNPRMPVEEKLKAARAILAPARDRTGLLVDLLRALQRTDPDADPLGVWKNAKLVEAEVSGRKAVGLVSMGEGEPRAMGFRKEGDSWRLDILPPPQPKGMPPGFQHPPM